MRLLIAENSKMFASILKERLQQEMEVCICHDGCTALELLQSFCPDVLVLNLHLPRKDGFTVLRQSAHIPRIILAVAGFQSQYVLKMSYALGISQLVLMPTANSLIMNLMGLIQHADDPTRKPDPRLQARTHLQSLNVPTHLDGYKQLAVALPLFAADPGQQLSKELYPAVAEVLGITDARQVERSMRTAIYHAWESADREVWAKYFPDGECPNNKRFLSRLAELIEL